MPHEFSWLIPDHVLMASLYNGITAEECQVIADKAYESINALPLGTTVHLVVDIREGSLQDKAWNYAKTNLQRHPNNGWTIVVGDSRMFGLMVAIFSKILNLHIRYSDTPESALKILADYHTSVAEQLQS